MNDRDTQIYKKYDDDDEQVIQLLIKRKNQWHGYSTYEKEGVMDTDGVKNRLSDDLSIKNKYETCGIQQKYEEY